LRLTVISESACSECHARGACTLADSREIEIDIDKNGINYLPGQEVTVVLRESLGLKALLYGYMIPFLLVLVILTTVYTITGNEILAGLMSLGILIPYYTILYFLRHYFKKVFKFELDSTD